MDLIFELLATAEDGVSASREPIGDELLERAEELRVFGVMVKVMSLGVAPRASS